MNTTTPNFNQHWRNVNALFAATFVVGFALSYGVSFLVTESVRFACIPGVLIGLWAAVSREDIARSNRMSETRRAFQKMNATAHAVHTRGL